MPARSGPLLVETCILHSRTTVGTALSSAKCTSGRQGTPGAWGSRSRILTETPRTPHEPHAPHRHQGSGRSFNLPEGRLSKSATKAPIALAHQRRIVDIPRFFSRSIPARGAFVADLDTPPPRTAPGVPPAPHRARPFPPPRRSGPTDRRARRERPAAPFHGGRTRSRGGESTSGRLFARGPSGRRRSPRGPWRPLGRGSPAGTRPRRPGPPPLLRDQCRSGGNPPGRERDRRHNLASAPGSPGGSGSPHPCPWHSCPSAAPDPSNDGERGQ